MTEKTSQASGATSPEGPTDPSRRRWLGSMSVAVAALVSGCYAPVKPGGQASAAAEQAALDAALRRHIRHVVIIYCENRSFNNLFADFPGVASPLAALSPEDCRQRDRDGTLLEELPPIWGGLVPHRQALHGKSYQVEEKDIGGLANAPWILRLPDGARLPRALVTASPVHRFYRNQMQINGGRNDGFVAWGDHGALPMGYYGGDRSASPLWQLAREFTLCDRFFMGAFGGSFLAHQYLISAEAPVYPDAEHSPAKHEVAVLDDGPEGWHLTLADDSPASAMDGEPKFVSNAALTPDFHAVGTFGPPFAPSFNTDPLDSQLADLSSASILPPQQHLTIGDMLSAQGVDWAWYGGAWQMALDGKGHDGLRDTFPDSPNFQPHHQPFNYFTQFGPGTEAREQHLRDGGTGNRASTNRFIADIEAGKLPAVSFYKPQGTLNMHAGYATVAAGDAHVGHVIDALKASPMWPDTLAIVTVDENGGWWDPVAPPKADRWGPGSRIPALVISPHAKKGHVEHAVHDTGSIQRLLNRRFGLSPLPGIVRRDRAMREHNGFAPGDFTEALDFST